MENNIDTSKLSVYTTDDDWVIAESENEARTLVKEFYQMDDEDAAELGFIILPNNKLLKIRTETADGEILIEKTIAEWIASNGKGYLCGLNF